jgi:CheY-like chemotaxis protein
LFDAAAVLHDLLVLDEVARVEGVVLAGGVLLADDILIVDDDEDLRALVALSLRCAGLLSEAVDGGAAALAAAERKRRKVVVCDVTMPEVSGLDVCRAIKRREADASQVLMLSANTPRSRTLPPPTLRAQMTI